MIAMQKVSHSLAAKRPRQNNWEPTFRDLGAWFRMATFSRENASSVSAQWIHLNETVTSLLRGRESYLSLSNLFSVNGLQTSEFPNQCSYNARDLLLRISRDRFQQTNVWNLPTIFDLCNSLADPKMIEFQCDRFIFAYGVAAQMFLSSEIIYNYKNDKLVFFQISVDL